MLSKRKKYPYKYLKDLYCMLMLLLKLNRVRNNSDQQQPQKKKEEIAFADAICFCYFYVFGRCKHYDNHTHTHTQYIVDKLINPIVFKKLHIYKYVEFCFKNKKEQFFKMYRSLK